MKSRSNWTYGSCFAFFLKNCHPLGLICLTAGLYSCTVAPASAQRNRDIPVPKSITVDRNLSIPEANRLICTAQLYYAFWNTGKQKYLKASVSADFQDNTLPKGRPQGYKGILFASNNFRKVIPGLRCSVEDLIITNNKIICRQVYTGYYTGSLKGHAPAGRPIRFVALDILHVRQGKVYEDWHLEDNLIFRQQIGVVPID